MIVDWDLWIAILILVGLLIIVVVNHVDASIERDKMEIHLVTGEDWEGLYINRELKAQHHSLDAHDILTILRPEFNCIELEDKHLNGKGLLKEELK